MAAAPPTSLTTVGRGVRLRRSLYLAGFRGSSYPTVPQLREEAAAAFDGTIDELAAARPELTHMLYNDVKVCATCSKPCAFTMKACNSCGASLASIAISKSENVFSAFVMGVKRAAKGFPYTLSLRRQTPDVLIFDDMLALTPCHINAISAKYYIPDWRYLLLSPGHALELLDVLEAECWTATQPFLSAPGFRDAVLRGGASLGDDVRSRVIRSFNFPPSQFQMHVQWLVPPLMPFQHYMAEIHNHFHEDRAFPLTYVRKVLELGVPYQVEANTPIEEIVAFYDGLGVVYKEHWKAFYQKCVQDSLDMANWDPNDFQYVVEDGKVFEFNVEDGEVVPGVEVPSASPAEIQAKDKFALQNYGRPYSADGKTTGTYIKAALQPKVGPGGYVEWRTLHKGGDAPAAAPAPPPAARRFVEWCTLLVRTGQGSRAR